MAGLSSPPQESTPYTRGDDTGDWTTDLDDLRIDGSYTASPTRLMPALNTAGTSSNDSGDDTYTDYGSDIWRGHEMHASSGDLRGIGVWTYAADENTVIRLWDDNGNVLDEQRLIPGNTGPYYLFANLWLNRTFHVTLNSPEYDNARTRWNNVSGDYLEDSGEVAVDGWSRLDDSGTVLSTGTSIRYFKQFVGVTGTTDQVVRVKFGRPDTEVAAWDVAAFKTKEPDDSKVDIYVEDEDENELAGPIASGDPLPTAPDENPQFRLDLDRSTDADHVPSVQYIARRWTI